MEHTLIYGSQVLSLQCEATACIQNLRDLIHRHQARFINVSPKSCSQSQAHGNRSLPQSMRHLNIETSIIATVIIAAGCSRAAFPTKGWKR